jgi:hypothetical protein
MSAAKTIAYLEFVNKVGVTQDDISSKFNREEAGESEGLASFTTKFNKSSKVSNTNHHG